MGPNKWYPFKQVIHLSGIQGGLQIGGRMITNLRYADDIILLATSEAETAGVGRSPRPCQPQI